MQESRKPDVRGSGPAPEDQANDPAICDKDSLGDYLVKKNRQVLNMLEEYDRRQRKTADSKKK